MDQQWVGKSLTIWGVIVAVLTAVVPAIGLVMPEIAGAITPEWIANLNDSVVKAISSVGVLVGSIMIVIDRLSNNVKKALVFRKPE